ncbi:hypothetical protein NPIL_130721 [Nephila pilipes]|uniref:Uncharacterized protein n=1 Tax=Nephila pilipes TaxID=299642 RepID=A0A8X6N1K7_NEPPI|nr:hypothetical protein NPIL_130721 [Nephila pilipes]
MPISDSLHIRQPLSNIPHLHHIHYTSQFSTIQPDLHLHPSLNIQDFYVATSSRALHSSWAIPLFHPFHSYTHNHVAEYLSTIMSCRNCQQFLIDDSVTEKPCLKTHDFGDIKKVRQVFHFFSSFPFTWSSGNDGRDI